MYNLQVERLSRLIGSDCMPKNISVPRPKSTPKIDMADILWKNIESVDELVNSYRNKDAMELGDPSDVIGYIFRTKNIACFVRGYRGPDQYLTDVTCGARACDYDPKIHAPVLLDNSDSSDRSQIDAENSYFFTTEGVHIRSLDKLETMFLAKFYEMGLNGRTALTDLAVGLAREVRQMSINEIAGK